MTEAWQAKRRARQAANEAAMLAALKGPLPEVTKLPPGQALGSSDMERWAGRRLGGRGGVRQKSSDDKLACADMAMIERAIRISKSRFRPKAVAFLTRLQKRIGNGLMTKAQREVVREIISGRR